MVPSPDWFIGLDSLNLCQGGHFVDSLTMEVGVDVIAIKIIIIIIIIISNVIIVPNKMITSTFAKMNAQLQPLGGLHHRYNREHHEQLSTLIVMTMMITNNSNSQADPLDAGTDNGFTFTSPNWPTEVGHHHHHDCRDCQPIWWVHFDGDLKREFKHH